MGPGGPGLSSTIPQGGATAMAALVWPCRAAIYSIYENSKRLYQHIREFIARAAARAAAREAAREAARAAARAAAHAAARTRPAPFPLAPVPNWGGGSTMFTAAPCPHAGTGAGTGGVRCQS